MYVWPGGGITVMVDVLRMPDDLGYVPTPALVAPIEFSMSREEYLALGGYEEHIKPLEDIIRGRRVARSATYGVGGQQSLAVG